MPFPPPTEKQARIIWVSMTGVAIALLVGLVAGLVWLLKWVVQVLGPVLWPLAVAGVLAYLLDPVVDYLERKRVKRQNAIVLVFGMALLILAAVFGSVIPQIIAETRDLARQIPAYSHRIQKKAETWINNPPQFVRRFLELKATNEASHAAGTNALAEGTNIPPAEGTNGAIAVGTNSAHEVIPATNSVAVRPAAGMHDTNSVSIIESWLLGGSIDSGTLQTATGVVTKLLPQIGSWLFGQVGRVASWFGILAGLALIPVYAFYLLLEKRSIERSWTDYLPVTRSTFKDELVFVLRSINDYLIAFFRGQVLVAICDGVLYTIGFLIIGLPYAVLIGFIATFLTIIPFIGAIVTCVVALVISLVTYGDWLHPALVLVVFAIVQALEGLVISPKIMGDRVGLHPLTIIIAVMAGTTILGGILGGILAIPLTAVLRVVLARYIWKRALDQAMETERPTAPSASA